MIMRELVRMGYDCVVITSDSNALADVPQFSGRSECEQIEGVEFCWVRTLKYRTAKSFLRIIGWLDFEWQLLRLSKHKFRTPDAVIVSSLSLLTVLNGLVLRARYRCRLIFEVRDIWPLTLTEEGGFHSYNPFVLLLGFVEKLGYRYADEVVGTMPNLGEHVASVGRKPRTVHCVPMGFDPETETFADAAPDGRLLELLPAGKFIVAHVGAMGITNALDTFFACVVAMKGNTDVHFLAVGDGDLRAVYEERYGNLPNLTMVPKVSKAEVPAVLAACDLLYLSVFASKIWRYGQSLNKLVDYMLAGKPVVASYSGFRSMIDEAGCGTFVAAGDEVALRQEILRYAEMPLAERMACGRRGRAWILENRSYQKLASQYLSIILPARTSAL
jgi:glycosyltransferase involved in cell wall biosynthesis